MPTSSDYQSGYRHALDNAKRDVAAALRIATIQAGQDEIISLRQAREIFASAFGVKAADDEFGPDDDDEATVIALGG